MLEKRFFSSSESAARYADKNRCPLPFSYVLCQVLFLSSEIRHRVNKKYKTLFVIYNMLFYIAANTHFFSLQYEIRYFKYIFMFQLFASAKMMLRKVFRTNNAIFPP